MRKSGTVGDTTIQEMRLEDAAEAHKLNQSGHVRGKIVLKIKDLWFDGVASRGIFGYLARL